MAPRKRGRAPSADASSQGHASGVDKGGLLQGVYIRRGGSGTADLCGGACSEGAPVLSDDHTPGGPGGTRTLASLASEETMEGSPGGTRALTSLASEETMEGSPGGTRALASLASDETMEGVPCAWRGSLLVVGDDMKHSGGAPAGVRQASPHGMIVDWPSPSISEGGDTIEPPPAPPQAHCRQGGQAPSVEPVAAPAVSVAEGGPSGEAQAAASDRPKKSPTRAELKRRFADFTDEARSRKRTLSGDEATRASEEWERHCRCGVSRGWASWANSGASPSYSFEAAAIERGGLLRVGPFSSVTGAAPPFVPSVATAWVNAFVEEIIGMAEDLSMLDDCIHATEVALAVCRRSIDAGALGKPPTGFSFSPSRDTPPVETVELFAFCCIAIACKFSMGMANTFTELRRRLRRFGRRFELDMPKAILMESTILNSIGFSLQFNTISGVLQSAYSSCGIGGSIRGVEVPAGVAFFGAENGWAVTHEQARAWNRAVARAIVACYADVDPTMRGRPSWVDSMQPYIRDPDSIRLVALSCFKSAGVVSLGGEVNAQLLFPPGGSDAPVGVVQRPRCLLSGGEKDALEDAWHAETPPRGGAPSSGPPSPLFHTPSSKSPADASAPSTPPGGGGTGWPPTECGAADPGGGLAKMAMVMWYVRLVGSSLGLGGTVLSSLGGDHSPASLYSLCLARCLGGVVDVMKMLD